MALAALVASLGSCSGDAACFAVARDQPERSSVRVACMWRSWITRESPLSLHGTEAATHAARAEKGHADVPGVLSGPVAGPSRPAVGSARISLRNAAWCCIHTPILARSELLLPQCALASACSFSSHRNQTPSRNGGQGGGGSGPEEEGQEGQAGGQEVNFFDALTPLPRPSFLHRSLLGGVY